MEAYRRYFIMNTIFRVKNLNAKYYKEFIVVLVVLHEAQNHKNNKFPFFIRKANLYFELLVKNLSAKFSINDSSILNIFDWAILRKTIFTTIQINGITAPAAEPYDHRLHNA